MLAHDVVVELLQTRVTGRRRSRRPGTDETRHTRGMTRRVAQHARARASAAPAAARETARPRSRLRAHRSPHRGGPAPTARRSVPRSHGCAARPVAPPPGRRTPRARTPRRATLARVRALRRTRPARPRPFRRSEPGPHQLLEAQRVDLVASPPAADIPADVSPPARHRASPAAATPRSGACASRSAECGHPRGCRRDDHSRPPRWHGPAGRPATAAVARFRAEPVRRATISRVPSTHSGVALRWSKTPHPPPTFRKQLRLELGARSDRAGRPLPDAVVEEHILPHHQQGKTS